MAEIVPFDDAEAKVDDAKSKADQTTEAEEENLKSDDEKNVNEKDAKYKKMAAELAALMADLDKPIGEINSNSTSSVCLRCREFQGEVDRLSTQNRSLINEMSSIKESNFFVKRNESLYLKKIKGYETEIDVLTCKLDEKT
ncbi:hypothetical protein Hanom_Chr05g00438521 [Helianthus anomalus]